MIPAPSIIKGQKVHIAIMPKTWIFVKGYLNTLFVTILRFLIVEQIITETLRKNRKVENPIKLRSLYNLCKRTGIKKL